MGKKKNATKPKSLIAILQELGADVSGGVYIETTNLGFLEGHAYALP